MRSRLRAHAVLVAHQARRRIGQPVRDAHARWRDPSAPPGCARAAPCARRPASPAPASRASPPSLLRSRSPLATDCSGLPSNSVSVDTTHSSTRSYISSTSTPSFRKISRCGLFLRGREAVGGDVVDRVLPLLHPADVVGERDRLLVGVARASRRSAAASRSGPGSPASSAMPSLSTRPNSFQNVAYFSGWCSARSSSRPSTRLTDAARIVCDVARLLQDLARDVQRQVVRVDDAADEAQVRRHQLLGIVHDEDAAHVQLDAVPVVAVPEVEWRALRDEEAAACTPGGPRPSRGV